MDRSYKPLIVAGLQRGDALESVALPKDYFIIIRCGIGFQLLDEVYSSCNIKLKENWFKFKYPPSTVAYVKIKIEQLLLIEIDVTASIGIVLFSLSIFEHSNGEGQVISLLFFLDTKVKSLF